MSYRPPSHTFSTQFNALPQGQGCGAIAKELIKPLNGEIFRKVSSPSFWSFAGRKGSAGRPRMIRLQVSGNFSLKIADKCGHKNRISKSSIVLAQLYAFITPFFEALWRDGTLPCLDGRDQLEF